LVNLGLSDDRVHVDTREKVVIIVLQHTPLRVSIVMQTHLVVLQTPFRVSIVLEVVITLLHTQPLASAACCRAMTASMSSPARKSSSSSCNRESQDSITCLMVKLGRESTCVPFASAFIS